MRIGVARIWQETNTFSPEATTLERFRLGGLYFGSELPGRYDELPELAGAAAAARERNEREKRGGSVTRVDRVEMVPLMAAMAWPAGRLEKDAFEFLSEKFLETFDRCGNLDGLMLSLHGALAAEGCDDVEGELLARVRRRVGTGIPIAVSLDMHANLTSRMAEYANAIVGYHTCPHLDVEETGQRAMEILLRTARAEAMPAIAWRKIPMIVPADRQNHAQGPLKELLDEARRIEAMPGILSCSLFAVQPWLDVEELGWSAVVISNGRHKSAQERADSLAQACWDRREQFFVEKLSPTEAVRKALEIHGRPVVISDSADSTNSGAPGNSTWLLKTILDAGVSEPVILPMVCPDAALAAHQNGVGSFIHAVFGERPVNPFSRPLTLRVRVVRLHDGNVRVSGHLGKNLALRMGRTAILEAGTIRIIASEHAPPGHVPPDFLAQLGIDAREAKIIVVKSPVGFRASYEPVAAGILLCEAPGPACSNLQSLGYCRRQKPLYPFEQDFQWSAAGRKAREGKARMKTRDDKQDKKLGRKRNTQRSTA